MISADRTQHSAASKVSRTGRGAARRSDGYERAARERHGCTNFSEASANNSAGSPKLAIASSLSISPSSVFNPTRPGSALRSASR